MAKRPLNQCSACGVDFASLNAFDKHRVGKHAYLADSEHPDGRRCLTADEMLAKEMRLDRNERWRGKASDSPWFKQAASAAA